MDDISCDIVVVGAGVLGLCVAAELTARGHDVRVIDPGGPNASSVAAGMIAPAFESLLDIVGTDRAVLMRDAAALWPVFADRAGLYLDTTPSEWRGDDGVGVAARLEAMGFSVERVEDRVRAPGDMKIDAEVALASLAGSLAHPILAATASAVERTANGWRVETTAGSMISPALVIATGAAQALDGLPEGERTLIDSIVPVAGQIGKSDTQMVGVLRGPDGYVAAVSGGALIGATMRTGSRDLTPDPRESVRLIVCAERLLGRALTGPVDWRAGVRGATADGLPLAGPSQTSGLHLALAPRRNGWLLGPLVGRTVADGIEGRPRGAHAAALDPMRFSLRE